LYGIAANYTTQKLSDLSPLSIATATMFSATLLLAPAALYFAPSTLPSFAAWASVLALAIVCTSLAYVIFFQLLVEVGGTRAITVTFLIPVFGALWGALFIGEELSLTMIVGMAVVLLGTALVTGAVTLASKPGPTI